VQKTEFRHEVLFYHSPEQFLAGTVPYLRTAIEAGEPALVAVGRAKIELLKGELGTDAEQVRFADMEELGRNPARIIPAWRDFVDDHVGEASLARGIGEPIWPGRGPAEVDECQRHESLLNVAFSGEPAWSLLCPYDSEALDDDILEAAAHCHPYLADGGTSAERAGAQTEVIADPFAGTLRAAPELADGFSFDRTSLQELRGCVAEAAAAAGLSSDRVADIVLAASELAANSVVHGGGSGRSSVWEEPGKFFFEVSDAGRIDQPLVGRVRPALTQQSGRGLWLANQLCDLMQIRSGPAGTSIRLQMSLP
jgi:anti-sigma regulatory factor (Ser/Thr protein kinase)